MYLNEAPQICPADLWGFIDVTNYCCVNLGQCLLV